MKKILLAAAILCLSAICFAETFAITVNGQPKATVILPKDATKAQVYAKDTLINYIEKISGATLPVSETPTSGNNIYIGQTQPVKDLLKGFDFSSLYKDGIYIKCNGKNRLVLTGDTNGGEIYSVYTFLEDYLGVKYYLSDDEYIPKKKTITVNTINFKYIPQMISRESFFKEMYKNQPDYALKMKQNGNGFWHLPKEYGGKVTLVGFAHTFEYLMNPEEYGKDHPEWFAIHGGVRNLGKKTAQLCLSNKEMIAELTKNVLKDIEKHPDDTIFSITQFDDRNYCECPECSALTEKYGHSGALLTVINQIAAVVKEKYPEKYLETFAYSYTQQAPKGGMKPADNVIIRLCSVRADFAHPFDHPLNKDFMTDLKDWGNISKNLYIWDYSVGYFNHLMPYPNTQVLQKDFRLLTDNNAIAMFSEGDEANRNGWLMKYKGYIIAKLCWDVNINMDKETKGFCNFYYGPAGKEMYNYIKLVEKHMSTVDDFLGCHSNVLRIWSEDQWKEGFVQLNKALAKVKGNKKYYDRVMDDVMGYNAGVMVSDRNTYITLVNSGLMPYNTSNELMDAYLKIKDEQEIKSPEEHYVWDNHFNYALRTEKPFSVPEECKNIAPNMWADYPMSNHSFGFSGPNEKFVKVIEEKNSASGIVAKIMGDQKDWYFMVKCTYLFANSAKYADMYMTYKVDMNETNSKDDYLVGLYSHDTKYAINGSISGDETPDGKYITKKIGTVDLENTGCDAYFYVAGNGKCPAGNGLYVDRIFFVYHD